MSGSQQTISSRFHQQAETCHGFEEAEVRMSGLRKKWLERQAAEYREHIWSEQGVMLDPGEREVILRHPEDNGKVSRDIQIS